MAAVFGVLGGRSDHRRAAPPRLTWQGWRMADIQGVLHEGDAVRVLNIHRIGNPAEGDRIWVQVERVE